MARKTHPAYPTGNSSSLSRGKGNQPGGSQVTDNPHPPGQQAVPILSDSTDRLGSEIEKYRIAPKLPRNGLAHRNHIF
ncbi:MAG: hypothetical protein OSA89_20550 [Mariniblastus sp.]|nr:hypothetical protein [Mariniblastus sp.]